VRKPVNLWLRSMGAGILLSILFSRALFGCTTSRSEVLVPPTFRISVWHEKEPVSGIQIAVYDVKDSHSDGEWKPMLRLFTAKDGDVEISGLHDGRYIVQTEGPGQGSAAYAIVSTTHKHPQTGITLQWPFSWHDILKVRTLTGELASNNPWQPFENIHLELWTAGASAPLAVKDTGRNGHFHFNETNPGIYVVRIRGEQKGVSPNWQVEGDIPIELLSNDTNAAQSLASYLSQSSCGIQYNSCPIPGALALPSRRLQVHDPFGAVIANANYRVLDPAGTELATGTTSSKGIAELPSELEGKVTLVVASTGFMLFTLPVDLIPPEDPAPYLAVVMGVQGYGGDQCSTAVLEKHAPQK
jgi:hypothetical protein